MIIKILKTTADIHVWIEQCKRYDWDFDPDIPKLPALVVYDQVEANGYADITHETFSQDELESYLLQMLEDK